MTPTVKVIVSLYSGETLTFWKATNVSFGKGILSISEDDYESEFPTNGVSRVEILN